MIQRAQGQLGGVSSGIGFIGSPEWVIGGAVVSGLLTSALSNAATKAGVETLNQAAQVLEQIRLQRISFEVGEIERIDLPHPKAWLGIRRGTNTIELNSVGVMNRGLVLKQHNKTKADIGPGNTITIPTETHYITMDDEFVRVRTHDDFIHLRWSSVETYGFH